MMEGLAIICHCICPSSLLALPQFRPAPTIGCSPGQVGLALLPRPSFLSHLPHQLLLRLWLLPWPNSMSPQAETTLGSHSPLITYSKHMSPASLWSRPPHSTVTLNFPFPKPHTHHTAMPASLLCPPLRRSFSISSLPLENFHGSCKLGSSLLLPHSLCEWTQPHLSFMFSFSPACTLCCSHTSHPQDSMAQADKQELHA